MTTAPLSTSHPVAGAVARAESELSLVAGTPTWAMSAEEAGDALVALARLRSEVDALTARLLVHGESVGTGHDQGATSTHAWWAVTTRTTRAEARRLFRLGEALAAHEAVGEALDAGDLRAEQAAVIVHAVEHLPDDIGPGTIERATDLLLTEARHHDAQALRVLGRRLLEVIDPVAADAEEARRLEAEEADARAAASFTMTDDGHGKAHGRFTIPTLAGQMLRKHLLALTSPRRTPTSAGDPAETDADAERRARGLTRHRWGLAFVEYLETRPEHTVPHSGGVPATVVVTMTLESLMGGLAAASLDTGHRITAGEARRLACRAGLIPAVLGGPSVVLDLGRKTRLHTEPMRIAMAIRDRGCSAAGCDTPPALCHAHHDHPWSHGGHTNVDTGRLLCAKHHHRIHDPAYQHTLDKHGQVLFSRRT